MIHIEAERLNLLPDKARELVNDVQSRYLEGLAIEEAAQKRLKSLRGRLDAVESSVMSATSPVPEDRHRELQRLQTDCDAASRRLQAMQDEHLKNTTLLAAVDRWLQHPSRVRAHMHEPTVDLVDVPLPAPDGTLAQVRAEIVQLKSKQAAVHRAPLAREEIEARIRSHVAQMAKEGRPNIAGIDGNSRFDVVFRAGKPQTILAWFNPEAMVNRLMACLPPVQEGAMSASGKRKTLADIAEQILKLERLDEALVRATGADRRPDADIRAVLSIEEKPRRAAAA